MKERLSQINWLVFAIILFSLITVFATSLFGFSSKGFTYIYCSLSFLIFISSSIIFWYLKSLSSEILELDNLKKHLQSTNQLNSEFKTILDNIDIAVCLRDENLNITYFNSCYAQITLADDKPIDCNAIEIDKFTRELAKLTLLNKNKRTSERFIVVRGKRHLYQFIDSYIPHSNQICSIAYDITDKELVAKELKLNIDAQKKLLESTNNAIAIFDSNRRIKYYNQAYVKLWELDESYLESLPRYEEILDKLHHEHKSSEYTNFFAFKQNRINFFTTLTDTYNDFLFLPDGRSLRLLIIPHTFGGLLFSFEDMTDHFALKVSYNTLIKVQQTTLNNLQEAVCVFGEDGAITLYNIKFKDLWGFSSEFLNSNPTIHELINNYKVLLNTDRDLRTHLINIHQAFQERKIIEEYMKRIDNLHIKRRMIPLPNGATMISDLDVTDSALMEQSLLERTSALENSDYIKSEFLSNVSYELRSPLTSIMGYAELLKGTYAQNLSEKKKASYVNNIIESSNKLRTLIDDLIDLTVALAGNIQLIKIEFDALTTVRNSIDLLDKLAKDNVVDCKVNYNESIQYMINGDKKRFEQVIIKLLRNAIEHSPPKSKVIIDLKNMNGYIQLSISNKGSEIPIEEQNFIFNKFYQGRNTKTNGRSGMGMGLSFVKEIVELHSGTIEFNSNQETGTTFTCNFPSI